MDEDIQIRVNQSQVDGIHEAFERLPALSESVKEGLYVNGVFKFIYSSAMNPTTTLQRDEFCEALVLAGLICTQYNLHPNKAPYYTARVFDSRTQRTLLDGTEYDRVEVVPSAYAPNLLPILGSTSLGNSNVGQAHLLDELRGVDPGAK
ncbi:hypothetical protein KIPB_013908, partial [Kipferlia bialata]|eukprot:g13908.t1